MKLPAEILNFLMTTEATHGLVWSRPLLEKWLQTTKQQLGSHTLSFAVKGFPWPEGFQVLSPALDAVDVSNLTEAKLVLPYLRQDASIWLTNGRVVDARDIHALAPQHTLWWNVGSRDEWSAARKVAAEFGAEMSLRVSTASLLSTLDPAYRPSRFGFSLRELSELPQDWKSEVRALHCHHGGERSTDETFHALLLALLQARQHFPQVSVLNLGGGWAKASPQVWDKLRKDIPQDLTLVVEPARAVTESAGFAFARVQSVQQRAQRVFLEGELSPGAHLRWMRAQEWQLLPMGEGERKSWTGEVWWGSRTCWEDDALQLSTSGIQATVGDIIVWSHVAGYTLSWNHSFNGIPAAQAFLVG